MSGMLKSVPVYAVLVEDLGERGAKFIAAKLLHDLEGTNASGGSGSEQCGAESSCCLTKANCNCKVLKQLLWVSLASVGLLYASSLLNRK